MINTLISDEGMMRLVTAANKASERTAEKAAAEKVATENASEERIKKLKQGHAKGIKKVK